MSLKIINSTTGLMLDSANRIVLLNPAEHFITFCRNQVVKILLYMTTIFSSCFFENHESSYYQEFLPLHLFSVLQITKSPPVVFFCFFVFFLIS